MNSTLNTAVSSEIVNALVSQIMSRSVGQECQSNCLWLSPCTLCQGSIVSAWLGAGHASKACNGRGSLRLGCGTSKALLLCQTLWHSGTEPGLPEPGGVAGKGKPQMMSCCCDTALHWISAAIEVKPFYSCLSI